jgi:hypothetical protein
MQHCVGAGHRAPESVDVEEVATDWLSAEGANRGVVAGGAGEGTHSMARGEQQRDGCAAYYLRCTGDEDS